MPPAAPSDVGVIRGLRDSYRQQARCSLLSLRLLSLASGMSTLYYHSHVWPFCMLQCNLIGVQSPHPIKGVCAPAPRIVFAGSQ